MKLVVAEKPSVGKAYASVLGATENKNGYMEGNGYIVSWCIGHLVELFKPDDYSDTWSGLWSYETLPIIPEQWKHKVSEAAKEQYEVLENLLNREDVTEVICGTDAGREGELIFRLVYHQAGCQKPMKRLWISSMEDSAIRDGFANLKAGSEYDNLYQSALCRSKADWLVGMNGTRLFTVLYKKLLNVGRVQTPTLGMLVEREEKISNFVKEPYYKVHLHYGEYEAVTDKISEKNMAEEIMRACHNRQALVTSVVKENKSVASPRLYDLTSLQRDANRLFGFTAKQTLEYTQSLYEKKLVTYPRTDSQYLTEDMEETAKDIAGEVCRRFTFAKNVDLSQTDVKKVMNNKKVTDHHAIIPTMQIFEADSNAMPSTESKILSLIGNRLLCAIAPKYVYESVKAEITCEEVMFVAKGKTVLDMGWKEIDAAFREFFKTKEEKEKEERPLSQILQGMVFHGVQCDISELFTKPLPHFTEDTLLKAMELAGAEEMSDEVERKGLGTPATRADVIEKLVAGGFVVRKDKQMLPTEDGIKLITVLPDIVKSPQLTANWENDLLLVGQGELAAEQFMSRIEDMVNKLVHTYHEVSDEHKGLFAPKYAKEVLGKCPHCGGDFINGKFGPYCEKKCGMNVTKYYTTAFTKEQIVDLLAGKRIKLHVEKGKDGKPYDMYLTPSGVEEYSYSKDGKLTTGFQFQYNKEYPKKNKGGK